MSTMSTAAVPSAVLSPDFDVLKIKKKNLDLKPILGSRSKKLAFVLKNVLTPTECTNLIKLSENKGYSVATINLAGGHELLLPGVRGGYRLLIDDKKFADLLFTRISSHLPSPFLGRKLLAINERLRFLKYDKPGDKFEPHCDGFYERPDGSASTLITLQIYLNEGFQGGNTTFLSDFNQKRVPVIPKCGKVLVFEHEILHEGSEMRGGIKYTIRMDVLYEAAKV